MTEAFSESRIESLGHSLSELRNTFARRADHPALAYSGLHLRANRLSGVSSPCGPSSHPTACS
jgi:hypothetical protein